MLLLNLRFSSAEENRDAYMSCMLVLSGWTDSVGSIGLKSLPKA